MKHRDMNKMTSGSKNLFMDSNGKKMMIQKQRSYIQFSAGSMHSSEKIDEMVSELEDYRWDAIILSETWRHE